MRDLLSGALAGGAGAPDITQLLAALQAQPGASNALALVPPSGGVGSPIGSAAGKYIDPNPPPRVDWFTQPTGPAAPAGNSGPTTATTLPMPVTPSPEPVPEAPAPPAPPATAPPVPSQEEQFLAGHLGVPVEQAQALMKTPGYAEFTQRKMAQAQPAPQPEALPPGWSKVGGRWVKQGRNWDQSTFGAPAGAGEGGDNYWGGLDHRRGVGTIGDVVGARNPVAPKVGPQGGDAPAAGGPLAPRQPSAPPDSGVKSTSAPAPSKPREPLRNASAPAPSTPAAPRNTSAPAPSRPRSGAGVPRTPQGHPDYRKFLQRKAAQNRRRGAE